MGPIFVDCLKLTGSLGGYFVFSLMPTNDRFFKTHNLLFHEGCWFMDERYPQITRKLSHCGVYNSTVYVYNNIFL